MDIREKFFDYMVERGIDSCDDEGVADAIEEFILENFDDTGVEKFSSDNGGLEKGTDIEYEHKPTYAMIKQVLEETGELPPPVDVYRSIARDHINEHANYYDDEYGLPAMERGLEDMEVKSSKKIGEWDPEDWDELDRLRGIPVPEKKNLWQKFLDKVNEFGLNITKDLVPNFEKSSDRGVNTTPIKSRDIDRIDGTEDSLGKEDPICKDVRDIEDNQEFVSDFVNKKKVNDELRERQREIKVEESIKRGGRPILPETDFLKGSRKSFAVPGSCAFNRNCFGDRNG